ncbi:hypothetical protein [Sorangium sp. So ce1000]|uniref:hypothetical protein n=1 Tax=Sorangium sp. So ce1000 TaxID=3133325 RepID=UPI003F5E683D
MGSKFDHWQWRKLYIREEGAFAQLPLFARALAAELLKFCDDEGRIFTGQREPWEAVARVAGAEMGERRMLRKYMEQLLADGYLERHEDHIVIKNLRRAQSKKVHDPSASGARPEHEPSASGARVVHESVVSGARVVHEPSARSDVSPGNDSEQPLTGARALLDLRRSEERRSEMDLVGSPDGEPDPPPAGSAGASGFLTHPEPPQPTKPRAPRRRKTSEPDLDPASLSPTARAVLEAILADRSLQPICTNPAQLAHDLADAGPGVDVVLCVKSAGAWMRANPARKKHDGNPFLLNWVRREQQERGGRSPPRPGPAYARLPVDDDSTKLGMTREEADAAAKWRHERFMSEEVEPGVTRQQQIERREREYRETGTLKEAPL